MDLFVGIFFFILGTIVGSFLNVCIVRMPEEHSVILPPSHCPHCKKLIFWYDNIPLLSYLFLRGKCRFCGEKISFQYFFVELVTGLTFMGFYAYFGLIPLLLPYLVFVSGLIVATFVDIHHRIIPDEISVGGMVLGIVLSFLFPQMQGSSSHLQALVLSLLGAFIGGGAIYLIGILGDFLFRKESMGGGDVKLLAMIGAFLGWQNALLTFFIAPFFGAIIGIIIKIRTKESLIPYGPFLALAAVISLFLGQDIINWILSGYGFYY